MRAFFLVVIAMSLMVMEKRMESIASIRTSLSTPLASLQYAVSWPIQFIDSLTSAISSHDNLVGENLRLKADQLLLKAQLQRLIAIESENNYLKALFQSSRKSENKVLIAELLAVSSEPFVHHIVIDKGSRDHIYVGQPVLDANGVMGQVIKVSAYTSRVLLINDPQSGVAVQSGRTGMRAIAAGDSDRGDVRLMYVPHTADIQVGDVFITSGLGGHYPEGYPVGKVISVNRDPSLQFTSVNLQPSARLNSSRQVLLIWYPKNA